MKGIGLRLYLFVTSLLVITVVAAVSIALWLASDQLQETASMMHDGVESIISAQSLLSNLEIHRRQSLLKNVRETDVRAQKRREAERELLESLDDVGEYVSPGEETRIANRVKATVRAYLELAERLHRQGMSGSALFKRTASSFDSAAEAIDDLIQINIDQAVRGQKAAAANGLSYKRWAIALFTAIALGVTLLILMLQRLIYSPVMRLRDSIEAYGKSKAIPDGLASPLLELHEISEAFRNLTVDLGRQSEHRLVFISSLAHDLKNPLSAIQMSLDLLAQDKKDGQDNLELFEILKRQVRQMKGLVEDLMDSTRIEAGFLQLNRSDENVCDLLWDSIRLFESSSRQHRIEADIPQEKLIVNCDSQRILQVFNNLMSNAIKYSPDGGVVRVRIGREPNQVKITIQDEGVGIPTSELQNIFQPFKRAESSSHQIAGVGLGLSTSKKIVEAHDGKIEVKSQLGLGTTFIVTLAMAPTIEVNA